jgi:hypothetical protein
MAAEDDEDVYDDEYDFVDDDNEDDADDTDADDAADDADEEEEVAEVKPVKSRTSARARVPAAETDGAPIEDEPVADDADDYARPAPVANYVVHVYEHQKFKRTIDRPFTAEDAEAFASEYNRTAKPYGRFALAGKDDAKPRKTLE